MKERIFEAERVWRAKREMRKHWARLPVKKKFEILIELQRRAYEIGRSVGRKPSKPWGFT